MSVKLLTEHHLQFLRIKGGCTGSSEYIHVKMPHFWKSHVIPLSEDHFFSEQTGQILTNAAFTTVCTRLWGSSLTGR